MKKALITGITGQDGASLQCNVWEGPNAAAIY
jgi:GDP-D-mannose dehydratase